MKKKRLHVKAVGASSHCSWDELMLLKNEIIILKCELMLVKIELMLVKCQINTKRLSN